MGRTPGGERLSKIVVDTDILVNHLRGVKEARSFLKRIEKGEDEGLFSTITEAELFSGKRMDAPSEQRRVSRLLSIMKRIQLDSKIARKSGEIRRRHGVPLPDAIIAATAYYSKAKIATKNVKHFKPLDIELEVPY